MKHPPEATRVKHSNADMAWAAGFFDGDGCTSITKQQLQGRKNPTYRLRLTLVQNCRETLLHFERVVDERAFIVTPGEKLEHNKQIYALIYEGGHALAALRKLAPYMIRKRMGASAAMRFWEEGRMGMLPGCRGFDASVWKARAYWFKKLRLMAKR